jgi:hypothetical protein
MWRKRAAPARQKRTYRTAEEVLAESQARGLAGGGGGGGAAGPGGGGGGGGLAGPILDLRGPTARVITDMEQLAAGGGARFGGFGLQGFRG